ncbi:MAG: hypothetical protein FWD61_09430 [Phycisphaerales bacterium]|nr:hypothetical protein [Phycisphaerales bacterium]
MTTQAAQPVEAHDLIVNENYPGLVKDGGVYRLDGDLKSDGSIIIRLDAWLIVEKGIEAGSGIKAGLSIICKHVLRAMFSIFAGICIWKKIDDKDRSVTCLQCEGSVACGILIETEKQSDSASLLGSTHES